MNITVPIPNSPPGYSQHGAAHPAACEQVTLNVSGQNFTTTIPALTSRSQYFLAFFRSDWKSALQANNTIFIDSDPEVFSHILKYLRRGVFPLSYDQKRGHNYMFYANMLAEAQHFQIPRLKCWLANQLYLNCITSSTVWSSSYKDDRIQAAGQFQNTSTWGSDVISTQLVKDGGTTAPRYLCGHQAPVRNTCTKKYCAGPASLTDDVETNRWAEVGKSITFHHGWCSDTGKDFVAYWDSFNSQSGVPRKS